MPDEITNVAGIEIPSTDPIFLAVVGIHVLLGLACTVTGAIAMLSQKRPGRHPRYGTVYFWFLVGVFLTATGLAAVRWVEDYHCSFLAHCRLRLRIWGGRLDGNAGAIGLDCTSPAWGHLTFCF